MAENVKVGGLLFVGYLFNQNESEIVERFKVSLAVHDSKVLKFSFFCRFPSDPHQVMRRISPYVFITLQSDEVCPTKVFTDAE